MRNATRQRAPSARRIEVVARRLLTAAGYAEAALSISFVGDAAMRRLNRDYRGRDATTDVLSFPLYEPFRAPKRTAAGEPEPLLGDLVISLAVARRQARDYGASLEREIARLLVHGIAHLLGHDHVQPRERRRMHRVEKTLAAAIGMPWPYAEDDGAARRPTRRAGSSRRV